MVVASRGLENNRRFVAGLNERGFDAHPEALDITNVDSISALEQRVTDRFGRVDILVNSAVVGRGGGFDDQTPDYWAASAQGNMVGLFALCKAFVPGHGGPGCWQRHQHFGASTALSPTIRASTKTPE